MQLGPTGIRLREAERTAREALGRGCVSDLARIDRFVTRPSHVAVFSDFNGTITDRDMLAALLQSYGHDALLAQITAERNERYGVDTLPIFANGVEARSDGWRVQFRDETTEGNAKRRYVEAVARDGYSTVVVGDDQSDFDMAFAADVREWLALEHLLAP
jgi:2-hydroxy-3-keto-5-methylthiopentenyl-1-phosphate phosphatase